MILRHFGAVMSNHAVLEHEDAIGEIEDTIVVCYDDAGAIFGDGYLAYTERTGRFLPKLRQPRG